MLYKEEPLDYIYLTCNIEDCKILYKGEIKSPVCGFNRYLKLQGGSVTTEDGDINRVEGVLAISVFPYSLLVPCNTKKIDDGNAAITLDPIECRVDQSLTSLNNWIYADVSLDQIEKMLERKENSNEQ